MCACDKFTINPFVIYFDISIVIMPVQTGFIHSLGRAAGQTLHQTAAGQVLAVFEHSAYLADSRQQLFCLGLSSIGCGPLQAVCDLTSPDWRNSGLYPGQWWQCHGHKLHLGGRLVLDYSAAQTWRAAMGSIPPKPVLQRNLARLEHWLEHDPPAAGFGPLLPGLCRGVVRANSASALLRQAQQSITALLQWFVQATPEPSPAARQLLGLGPGLTPSGDDFIGGVMLTARALGCDAWAERLAYWVLPLAHRHTNRISNAHLQCAALGEGAEVVHTALSALNGERELRPAITHLTQLGHSSGWDTLAGMVCAYAILPQHDLTTR